MEKLVPQPQLDVAFGFSMTNRAPISSSLKSITEGWGWDVWTYPEYAQLLDTQQQYLNLAYVGEISCQEALDQIATLHQRTLDTSPNNPANQ